MVYVSQAKRRELKRRHQLACPTFLGYPLDSYTHVVAAAQRYAQRKTRKCAGGAARICRAAARLGIHSSVCPVHGGSRAMEAAIRPLISKKIKVLDLNCSTKSRQGTADRFDWCEIEGRRERGRHGEIVTIPGKRSIVHTVFVGTYPERAFARELRGMKIKLVLR
jgi:hypothetical protein